MLASAKAGGTQGSISVGWSLSREETSWAVSEAEVWDKIGKGIGGKEVMNLGAKRQSRLCPSMLLLKERYLFYSD